MLLNYNLNFLSLFILFFFQQLVISSPDSLAFTAGRFLARYKTEKLRRNPQYFTDFLEGYNHHVLRPGKPASNSIGVRDGFKYGQRVLEKSSRSRQIFEDVMQGFIHESTMDLQNLSQVTSKQERFSRDKTRAASAKDISLRGINLAFGSLVILEEAHVKLAYGTKYALIGRNGIGKTTLLRCMANNLIPQWQSIRTFMVEQEYAALDETPLDLVKSSDPEHQSLLKSIKHMEDENDTEVDVDQLAELYGELEFFEESAMEKKAVEVLKSLKFTDEMMKKSFRELSGGWRMKTMLACAVFAEPNLLLMDEPTNHLDLKSIYWLVNYLKELTCTVIVVSHDHDFLDRYTECIIHLTQKKLRYYPGNYSDFKGHRDDKLREQSNTEKKKQLAKESGSAKTLKRLEGPNLIKMPKKNAFDKAWTWGGEVLLQGVEGDDGKIITLKFPIPDQSVTDPLVQLKSISYSFENRTLWKEVDLSISKTSRIAILGRNGIGKSTLLKCIAGTEKPTTGQITRHHNLQVAFFSQHLMQELDLTLSAVEFLMKKFKDLKVQEARDYLGSFGISGNLALERLGVLSGGQKVRFIFALLMYYHPHLLLLDEPTSHLDMEMTESLINALNSYEGAVVVISHHSYFLRNLNCTFYVVKNTSFIRLDSLEEYLSAFER